MRKEQIALTALALWLSIVLLFMLLSRRFDFELFFVLWFIGFLVIAELIEPDYIQPGYLRYFKYIMVVGLVILGAIVVQKVMGILAAAQFLP